MNAVPLSLPSSWTSQRVTQRPCHCAKPLFFLEESSTEEKPCTTPVHAHGAVPRIGESGQDRLVAPAEEGLAAALGDERHFLEPCAAALAARIDDVQRHDHAGLEAPV